MYKYQLVSRISSTNRITWYTFFLLFSLRLSIVTRVSQLDRMVTLPATLGPSVSAYESIMSGGLVPCPRSTEGYTCSLDPQTWGPVGGFTMKERNMCFLAKYQGRFEPWNYYEVPGNVQGFRILDGLRCSQIGDIFICSCLNRISIMGWSIHGGKFARCLENSHWDCFFCF